MEALTLKLLNEKLKDAPQSVLERVIGYVDALIEPTERVNFVLTTEQQKTLDNQINLDKSVYIEADKLYDSLKSKYEL